MSSATKIDERKVASESPEAESSAPRRAPDSLESLAEQIKETLAEAWLPRYYRERILPLRTRAHQLQTPANVRPEQVNVQHTLLGVELKIGRRRIACPDLATARYLATFARAGCTEVAVPYDISRISLLADELESGWQRMLLLVEHLAGARNKAYRTRLRNSLVSDARREIAEAGSGTLIPQFNQNTKQRRRGV
ncbi:MAG TPA: hypothetical protein VGX24_13075 [Pyrinomonadaceae bacterium]|jgi:hypothetical protein|nr:hypothetical protein [Pyrinomonadaceae bacterium]